MRFENYTPDQRLQLIQDRQIFQLIVSKDILDTLTFTNRFQIYPEPSPVIPYEEIKKGLIVSDTTPKTIWTNFQLEILNNGGIIFYKNIDDNDEIDVNDNVTDNDCLIQGEFVQE